MKNIKTLAVLAFVALLSLGVASCFNPTGPGTGGGTTGGGNNGGGNNGGKDTVRHGKPPVPPKDTIRTPPDTIRKNPPPPPPPPPPPKDSGIGNPGGGTTGGGNGVDSTIADSIFHHRK